MRKNRGTKKKARRGRSSFGIHESLEFHTDLEKLIRQVEELAKTNESNEDRLQDLEIHVNLLTRLLTTLCVEKLGMRVGVLKRLIKRIEKEAIRDSQIMHLESLYKLPTVQENKKTPPAQDSKKDPWEEIS